MELRSRFTLYFSVLVLSLLTLFSALVYLQVRKNVFAGAERALIAHLEHDAQHVGHSHDSVHSKSSSPPADNVYLRVLRDGALVEDSFPHGKTIPVSAIEKRIELQRDGHDYELIGYYDLARSNTFLSTLRKVLALGCLLALLVVIPFGLVLTRFLLKPFRALAQQTSELDARTLAFRFPDPRLKDEYGALVRNFNQLLDRLEGSFVQIRRFASNASHELRTPLAVIIGQTEMALRRTRTVDEHRDVAEKVLAQAKHLRDTTNRLLTLAHLERAGAESSRTDIAVADSIRDVVETLSYAYRATGKRVVLEGLDRPLALKGSEEIFRSIVSNLVENALKYSRATVVLAAEGAPDALRLRIEDDGPGIPAEARAGAFQPASEAAGAVDGPLKSHGIGLSLVKACLDACRGEIRLGESRLGGLSVDIFLPQPA